MKTNVLMVLLAGTVLLAACGSAGNEKADYAQKLMDSAMADTTSPKLVKTADMKLKVTNVPKAAEAVAQLTKAYHGRVMHNNINSEVLATRDITISADSVKRLTVYNTAADMTVQVPAEHIEEFMDKLNHTGIFIDNRKMDVEDRTLDYLSQELKAQNRDNSVKLRRRIKLTQRVADRILTLNDDAVDRRIGNLKTRQDVDYSTLVLALYQSHTVHAEMVANTDLSGYNNSFSVNAGLATRRGWAFFTGVITCLLYIWPFMLLALGGYAGYWHYKKRQAAKVLLLTDVKN